ncbi:P-loop containing nucleoside triphosphate hydrolase protein [Trichoderma chlorosporum]
MTAPQEPNILSNPALLEKVDKLRDFNIGRLVPLPQLVVVGDQSSGKSSLLESLTGIPFPKDQGLCTRYATQITSRRDNNDSVDIRIIPGPHESEEHKKHVEGFHMQVHSGAQLRKQFPDILEKVNEKMGLRTIISTGSGAVFSEDVLKIEICGPREDYLTIIDVPGIFRDPTKGTTKDDMAMVENLVRRYVKDSRTIILAVLPSNIDIATQGILQIAEEYDTTGERTLGVLTKADLVKEPSAQSAVCDLIQGDKRPLNLGYFLVRNRGPDCDSGQSELEQIFRQGQWADLPKDRVGIKALKAQLTLLLVEITRREFPILIQDVTKRMRDYERELSSLGPSRQNERDQRSFLCRIAETFQDRVRAALAADYNADSVFEQDKLRLITNVVNITDVFSADFRDNAHSRHFEKLGLAEPSKEDEILSDDEKKTEKVISDLRVRLEEAHMDDATPEERIELDDILTPEGMLMPKPCDNFSEWINDVYMRSRGLDLGTFNPNFLSTAFAEQSRKWGDMTKIYMSRIIITLHRFIDAALRSVCTEEKARGQLWTAILGTIVEKYKTAMEQARLLVEVEQRKQPYTLNKQFAQARLKAQGYRLTELMRPKARKDKQYGEVQYMVNLDDIAKAAEGKNNLEQLQEEIHDILHAYYSLAADRLIDNVFQLAVDHHLLHGPCTPLKVFTPEWVINLGAEDLQRIIGWSKNDLIVAVTNDVDPSQGAIDHPGQALFQCLDSEEGIFYVGYCAEGCDAAANDDEDVCVSE